MKKVFWPLIIAISVSLGVLLGGFLVSAGQRNGGISYMNSSTVKLNRLLEFIDKEYVDQVNTDSIVEVAVNSILEQLDPHSVYIDKRNLTGITESMQGSFVGIGISYYDKRDTIVVIESLKGGPAYKGGLVAGDRVISADEQSLVGETMTTDSITKYLRGTKDTKVNLKVFRPKVDSFFTVQLERQPVPLASVDTAIKLSNGLGYIKVNRFAGTTYQEFSKALSKLKAQDISGLVLDLRGNGGGFMQPALDILDDLLAKDEIIVKVVNRGGDEKVTKAKGKGAFVDKPLYVLVDEESASSSEIIAGAVQDNDRGVIVGRRTFGKGLVQRELSLGDGSAVRLTTARYFTPSGRSIQKPYKDGIAAYNKDFAQRYQQGELYQADSIQVADSLKFRTTKGKLVYGGGGIVPDVFVPISKDHSSENVRFLMESNLTRYFVFEVIDKERLKYEKLTEKEIINKVLNTNEMYDEFISYLRNNKLDFKLDKSQQLVKEYLIAEFLKQLLGDEVYYEWLMEKDPMLQAIKE